MAIITSTPIQIDPTNFGRVFNFDQNPFMFQPGDGSDDVYAVLQQQASPGTAIEIFKSTDHGHTWTQLDAAHQPTGAGISTSLIQSGITRGTLSVGYIDQATGHLAFALFSMITDTWGTVRVNPNPTSGLGGRPIGFMSLATNNATFFVTSSVANITRVGFFLFSWSSSTLTFGTNFWITGVFVDSVGNFYIAAGNASNNLVIQQTDPGFNPTALMTPHASGNYDFTRVDWLPLVAGVGTNAIAWTEFTQLFIATWTVAGFPTVSVLSLGSVSAPLQMEYGSICLGVDGKYQVFGFVLNSNDGSTDQVYLFETDGVTVTGPTIFYDAITNPPPNSATPFNQFVHTGKPIQFSNLDWLFVTAMETKTPAHCTGFALVGSGFVPPVPPIRLTIQSILPLPNPLKHCPGFEDYVMGRVTTKTPVRKRGNCVYSFRSK